MFEQIGWEIREVSIDIARGIAVMRLFRRDGLWLFVAADASGKSTIERWQRESVMANGRGCSGRGFKSNVIKDSFLGRSSCFGARSALRAMCDYVAENPAPGCASLSATTVRNSVRLLMGDE